jgi:protein-L-isoaspartate(D-aspartate) O-methyltransferase
VKDNLKHGQGTLIFGKGEWEGDKYVGEFKNGKYDGQGTYTHISGAKYVGEYKDDSRHVGTYTFANGNKYVGEWKDDKYHGQGILTYASGSTESGIWADNELIEYKSVSSVKVYLGLLQEMEQRRNAMVQEVLAIGISDEAILAAMAAVPMEVFAPADALELVYGNNPVPIGYNESISQPTLTAAMLRNLDLQEGDKVLELKTASGYQTVLLAQMGMDVITIESDWALAAHLREVFKEFDFPNINLKVGSFLRTGWPNEGPYDAIIATAAYANMPYKIQEQLAPGGVFIVPVGTVNQQFLLIVRKDADGILNQATWMEVRFSMMPNK